MKHLHLKKRLLLALVVAFLLANPALSQIPAYPTQPCTLTTGNCVTGYGQNLIGNGDFETLRQAGLFPSNVSNMPRVLSPYSDVCGWFDATMGDADYFHRNSNNAANIPNGLRGFKETRTTNNNAYTGINVLQDLNGTFHTGREYIHQQLQTPLITGKKYYAEFYASLEDGSSYAINNLAMLFTNNDPYQANLDILNNGCL